jgi:hypothetical protein
LLAVLDEIELLGPLLLDLLLQLLLLLLQQFLLPGQISLRVYLRVLEVLIELGLQFLLLLLEPDILRILFR